LEIKIPEGLVGLTNPLGSPDHGLEIPLEYGTGINIFAAYNALDRKSTKELWESELQMIKGSSLGIQSVKESAAQLCGWNAIHAIVEYARYTRPPGMDEVVVSLDQPPNEAGVGKVFVLHLHSTGDFFKNDRKWFEEVANSFKCFDSK
jgi:hypothetical protein